MICSKCGKEMEPTWKKCHYCGNELTADQIQGGGGAEKQETNKSSNNVSDPKLSKKGKKNRKPVIIIILLIVVIYGLYQCGTSGDDAKENNDAVKTEEAVTDNETGDYNLFDDAAEETDEPQETNEQDDLSDASSLIGNDLTDDRHRTNEKATLYLDNGGEMTVTVTDWGQYKGIYINYEIENTGTKEIAIGDSMFSVYGDDYKMDLSTGENSIYYQTIAAGRKASGTLYIADANYRHYQTIEVDCGGFIYLLWDGSFIDSYAGSYSWEQGESGANLTFTDANDSSIDYLYYHVLGECWSGAENPQFSTSTLLDCVPIYNSDTGVGCIKVQGWDPEVYLEVYKTKDGGLYVEQFGTLSYWTDDYVSMQANFATFTGTYHAGLADIPQSNGGGSQNTNNGETLAQYGNFTMTDLGLVDEEINFYWEKGENEDATGSDIYISYDESLQTVRVIGIWSSSADEEDFDCVVKEINDDGSFTVTDGLGTTLLIQFLDADSINVEQTEDLAAKGNVFNGTYQKR